ncbi:MAG: GEVED domain-containing protein [Planctomycetaceae bacterium]
MRRRFVPTTESLEQRLVLDVSAPAILQVFDSTYFNIEDRAADIFAAGYGGIWIPPTGRADSGNFSVGYDVFNRFDLGSPGAPTLYGTETGLKTTVDVLHNAGVNVYVDFVLNHNGFSDAGTPGFVDAGGYPGFAVTLGFDVDGDFHGAFDSGDINGRLAGLIDIAQEKNYQFIRQPVDPSDPNNIPAGTVNNVADPNNARFYPDRELTPIMLFNPLTGQSDIPVYPFNTNDPLQGDPVMENALGLLMRNAQWLVQEIGVDGFRLDAAKHFDNFVMEYFDQAVYRSVLDPLLDGSTQQVFSFSEVFDGDKAFQQTKIRKDINPADPGRIGGNRDVLDFPLFFAMQANLTGNGFANDWRNIKNASQDIQDDGLANNGSQGVAFAVSHDNQGPELSNIAHAYILMRPGNAIVYFNAEEFGQGRDFPKDGRGDALGGQFGDAIPTLVNIRNTHGRGDYIDRTPGGDEKEMLIFERSASSLVVLSNRMDAGFDSRTIQTNFLPGTPLVELTGNAANPVIDPFNDFPEVLVVNGDGTVNLRVPRNVAPDGTQHNSGYLIYGPAGPQGTLSLSNVTTTLAPETPTPETNGTARLSEIGVISSDSFDVTLATSVVNHLGSIRDQFADGDNALLRLDGGIDLNGNAAVDFTAPGNVSYGFEQFTTVHQPGYFEADGNGLFVQTIDTTQLSEGEHFLEVQAYRHREPGEGDTIYTPFRKTIYIDRLAPISEVAGFDPIVPGINENRQLRIQSVDLTANSVHTFLDLPASLTDAEILAMLSSGSQTDMIDRNLFSRNYSGVTSGNHVATVVTYEVTGNYSIQRIPGLNVSSIFGAGLGDLDFDGDVDIADINLFETVYQANGSQFNPAGDFNADGLISIADLPLFHQFLLNSGAAASSLDAFDAMVISNAPVDYGDAPASYPTLQAAAGAHHILTVGPYLGLLADSDPDGQPNPAATGDDISGTDDEDGIVLPPTITPGTTATISVSASAAGLLNAFIDLNHDGDFFDSGEQFTHDLALTTGTNNIDLTVPVDAVPGTTVMRFRFGSYPDVGPTGLASDGEVEDTTVLVSGLPDLIATRFNAVTDHVLNARTDVEFRISNIGGSDAPTFQTHLVWSPNQIAGDSDDVVIAGTSETFVGLAAGADVSRTISVQLDAATLFAYAATQTAAGLSVGTVSSETSWLLLVIDTQNEVTEISEANNSNRGHLIDGDDITYFPWDGNGNGVIEPQEALAAIHAIGLNSPASDFDGNGVVTPLEALSSIQRIGYQVNNAVIGDAPPSTAQVVTAPAFPDSSISVDEPQVPVAAIFLPRAVPALVAGPPKQQNVTVIETASASPVEAGILWANPMQEKRADLFAWFETDRDVPSTVGFLSAVPTEHDWKDVEKTDWRETDWISVFV